MAETLSFYINSITLGNLETSLGVGRVEEIVGNLNGSLEKSSAKSFIMAEQPNKQGNIIALGVSFKSGNGSQVVRRTANTSFDTSSITTGAIVDGRSLLNLTSLNMLVIADPLEYKNIGDSNITTLASSVIVVTAKNLFQSDSMNVTLYLQTWNVSTPSYVTNLSCSYYDTNTRKWSSAQCTVPHNNSTLNRYECTCNHLSTYALVWSRFVPSCNDQTEVLLDNGTCIAKENLQV